jgi:hypothetical protein
MTQNQNKNNKEQAPNKKLIVVLLKISNDKHNMEGRERRIKSYFYYNISIYIIYK